jgi:putative transposase
MSLQQLYYPSDLTDQQWELIQKQIPHARRGGRPRTTDVRQVVNALFYLNRTGCAWRYLPKQAGFPPWKTVYDYFAKWRAQGIWKRVHDFLVRAVRQRRGRNPNASVLIVDAQSAKAPSGEARGYDGFKKVKGRKRSLFVDTLGLIHSVKVDPANQSEYRCAFEMLKPEQPYYPNSIAHPLSAMYADAAYKPIDFQDEVKERLGILPTLTSSQTEIRWEKFKSPLHGGWDWRKVKQVKHSNLKPVRWIVERTFAWFNHYRRLAKDYERKTTHSETMIYLAMTQLMLRKLDSEGGS